MARKSLSIVANEATKRVLAQLGSPLIQVAVKGRVVSSKGGNALVIENVSTSKSTTLPIVAGPVAKKALADAAHGSGSHEITLLGRVTQSHGSNVLLLDRVGKAHALPIIADGATRQLLAGLAAEKGGELTVKARVVESNGSKILVLAGEGGAKSAKKK
jgi:hypothetical protein